MPSSNVEFTVNLPNLLLVCLRMREAIQKLSRMDPLAWVKGGEDCGLKAIFPGSAPPEELLASVVHAAPEVAVTGFAKVTFLQAGNKVYLEAGAPVAIDLHGNPVDAQTIREAGWYYRRWNYEDGCIYHLPIADGQGEPRQA